MVTACDLPGAVKLCLPFDVLTVNREITASITGRTKAAASGIFLISLVSEDDGP